MFQQDEALYAFLQALKHACKVHVSICKVARVTFALADVKKILLGMLVRA